MGCQLSGLGDRMGMNGQDPSHASQQEAFQMLGSYEQPITLQIQGQRGHCYPLQRTSDCSTQTSWDTLRRLSAAPGSHPHTRSDRPCCGHMPLPAENYLPTISQDLDNMDRMTYRLQEPNMSESGSRNQSCLIGCCGANLEEPSSFLSQTEDERMILGPPVTHQPLLHELDSGLGCTDGSFHQGELSSMETEEEEGVEDGTSRAGSSSSESFISSELSDSGFYSVGAGEFRRFQKLLEKKIRLYRSRTAPRRGAQRCRRGLESIPEAFQTQDVYPSPSVGHRCLTVDSSVQSQEAEGPCPAVEPLLRPIMEMGTCSAHSCQQRLLLHQQASLGHLRRSHTLHRCAPHVSDRRRASHPTSPSYYSTTLYPAAPASRHPLREQYQGAPRREFCCAAAPNNTGPTGPVHRPPCEQWSHTLGPSQDIHDTWPKSAGRCSFRAGLYSTLDPCTRRGPPLNPRAQRNQMLRDRASQLAYERGGTTTDEEAGHGEAGAGRYRSRTERRQQLELAREQRLQALARGGDGDARSTLLELSHRKLSRLRDRKLLDDWTTVEELLTHGTRLGTGGRELHPSSLLSVTTV